jgi:NarL family two-component system sensor histidine kinase YdfH
LQHHDTLAQGLVGLVLQLETINAHLTNSQTERAQQIVQISVSRARNTLAEARQAIDDLRRTATSEADFFQMLRQAVEQFSATTGLECRLEVPPFTLSRLGLLPALVRECVLRGLNEGLTNIARYAQASRVRVSLNLNPLKSGNRPWILELRIEDNGVGFKSFDFKQLAATGHYGLMGLQERSQLLGGNLELSRLKRTGSGTILRLQLPVTPDEQAI